MVISRPTSHLLRLSLLVASFATAADGHGAVTVPPSRNAVDRTLEPWRGPVPTPVPVLPFEPWCPLPSSSRGAVDGRNISGANGQACFFFSNGCTPGCAACDGVTRGPLPNFTATPPQGKREVSVGCTTPAQATNCDPRTRSVNTGAECGAADDFYYYSPWRRPGSAPVFDACGIAGGKHGGPGSFGAVYRNTSNARQGDPGSKLKPAPSGTVWVAGAAVEVAWTIQSNHGGGYSYRLCSANEELTERCFQQRPLRFTGKQAYRWGGARETMEWFDGVYLDKGTTPAGSQWVLNPVPSGSNEYVRSRRGKTFAPRCKEEPGCNVDCRSAGWPCANTSGMPGKSCRCSGIKGPYDLEIVDTVQLPGDLASGEYVLGFRWDCEESSQVWQSCSDVTIKAHGSSP